MIKKFYNPLFIFVLAFLISLPVILPYFHSGYFPTHDGEWAVVRLGDMFRSLRDHQFPVRYSGNLNFGYGYPLFNFVYPAPYYLGVILHFFRVGFVDTIKLLFASSVVISAVTMYLASQEIWKNKISGIISSLFYVYLPYRIVDLYARGSLGESLSFALFPLIIFCASKVLDNANNRLYIVLGSISYALLIMTHNIMALLFTPLLFIYIFIKLLSIKVKSYLNILIFILLSYSLSAFFWIPALFEKRNIALSLIPIADRNIYFVKLSQLLIPKWGYGLPDHASGFSYQIGIAHIIVLFIISILSTYLIIANKKSANSFRFMFALVTCITTFILIILMFPFTKIIWEVTPFLKEVNYPWTLLAQIGFLISLLSGFLWTQKKLFKYLIIVLCLVVVGFTLPNAKPQAFFDKGDGYYLTNDATTTSSQELMPTWVKKNPIERTDKKIEILKGNGAMKDLFFNSKSITFYLDLKSNSTVQVNTIYYPGWTVKANGKSVPISYNNTKGVIEFSLPAGNHGISLEFSETPLRLISDGISLVSVVGLVFLLVLHLRKGKKS